MTAAHDNRLADAVAAAETDERRRALRALLARPLLSAHGPEAAAFALVRKHAGWLRDVLAREAGWQLQVDAEFARLRKTPADTADATRGAFARASVARRSAARPSRARPSGPPFTRRRYVLLCLALAGLERADHQVTLGFLAERIIAGASDPALQRAGIRFDLDSRDERSDLVAVVRLLLDLRVLERVAGDELAFVNRSGDALYDVDRRLLAAILASRRGPSTVTATDFEERLHAITAELVADTDDARLRQSRHRLARRLLDDPVVYDADLDDDDRAYLARQRTALTRRLADATGLVPELRAEGTALLDPTGEATDLRMPEEGTDGHAALLVAEHLAEAAAPVPLPDLQAHLWAKANELRAYWRKSACDPGGPEALCLVAVRRLEALGLVAVDGGAVVPRPALARYRAGAFSVVGATSDAARQAPTHSPTHPTQNPAQNPAQETLL